MSSKADAIAKRRAYMEWRRQDFLYRLDAIAEAERSQEGRATMELLGGALGLFFALMIDIAYPEEIGNE